MLAYAEGTNGAEMKKPAPARLVYFAVASPGAPRRHRIAASLPHSERRYLKQAPPLSGPIDALQGFEKSLIAARIVTFTAAAYNLIRLRTLLARA